MKYIKLVKVISILDIESDGMAELSSPLLFLDRLQRRRLLESRSETANCSIGGESSGFETRRPSGREAHGARTKRLQIDRSRPGGVSAG